MVMTEAPQNAVVLTWTALDSFPLWYYQFAEHQRLDLALVVVPLTQFSWYRDQLSMQYPDLSIPDEQDLLQQDPTTPAPELWGRPVCGVHTPDPGSSRMSLICQSPSSKAQAQP
jgi:hypothetical protein